MDAKGIEKIEDKIENVEHVTDIISYNSMVGAEVPTEIIPSKYNVCNRFLLCDVLCICNNG